ncbi:MAG: histidine phosphatase family protein [Pseudomonadales bacterium]
MTTLILVRHAESLANVEGIAEGGEGNSLLTTAGIEQANRLGTYLRSAYADIDAIYSSPLIRAHETAKHVALLIGRTVRIEGDLREGLIGKWEGSPPTQKLDWEALKANPHFKEHGGESPFELAERSARAMKRIASIHKSSTTLIVSHGATITHGLARILGTQPVTGEQYALQNTGFVVLNWTQDPPQLLINNETHHLTE